MNDSQIVALYWQRNEQAITETAEKYGNYCYTIAFRILTDKEDAEECVNDAWNGAWNSMPENRPEKLAPYLAKLTRWLSFNRLREKNALKRKGNETTVALEELSDCFDPAENVQREIEQKELSEAINTFLNNLDEEQRNVFVARYWFILSIREISEKFDISEGKVKSMLMRSRLRLKKYLEEEELC